MTEKAILSCPPSQILGREKARPHITVQKNLSANTRGSVKMNMKF